MPNKPTTLRDEPCIYCKKPVNQMIQPWNYLFPDQIFHLGCQQSVRSTELLSKIEGMKWEITENQLLDHTACKFHNESLDQVISLINQEK